MNENRQREADGGEAAAVSRKDLSPTEHEELAADVGGADILEPHARGRQGSNITTTSPVTGGHVATATDNAAQPGTGNVVYHGVEREEGQEEPSS